MSGRYETEIFTVDFDRPEPLVKALEGLRDGSWINVEPLVEDEGRDEVSGIFAWFSARGPQVPVGTYVAGSSGSVASVGVEHGVGGKAVELLSGVGIKAPEAWTLKQDHPKRGLVWEVASRDFEARAVVDLLLMATRELCLLRNEGEWTVMVNRRS